MPKNNLKPKNLSKKPLSKSQASFGVFLKRCLGLYGFAARMVNRFRHTGKPLNENRIWSNGIRFRRSYSQTVWSYGMPFDETIKRYESRKRKLNNNNFGDLVRCYALLIHRHDKRRES